MGLKENLQEEPVRKLPLREVIVVEPATPLRAAIQKMREKQLGCAVMVGQDGKPNGIFTERSVLDALVSGKSLDDHTIGEFADPNFQVVGETEPIDRVWRAILDDGRRFICVTDQNGELVGLTGQRGLAEYVAEHFPQQIMVQRLGSEPAMKQREGA